MGAAAEKRLWVPQYWQHKGILANCSFISLCLGTENADIWQTERGRDSAAVDSQGGELFGAGTERQHVKDRSLPGEIMCPAAGFRSRS